SSQPPLEPSKEVVQAVVPDVQEPVVVPASKRKVIQAPSGALIEVLDEPVPKPPKKDVVPAPAPQPPKKGIIQAPSGALIEVLDTPSLQPPKGGELPSAKP